MPEIHHHTQQKRTGFPQKYLPALLMIIRGEKYLPVGIFLTPFQNEKKLWQRKDFETFLLGTQQLKFDRVNGGCECGE